MRLSAAMTARMCVLGINFLRFPKSLTSRVPASWSMMPTVMNIAALAAAWLYRWSVAPMTAPLPPKPRKVTMRPSWLMVPYARIAFKS